jgi:MYXO-CTERM domain-containing protein
VKARRFVAGFWVASMAISGVLATLVIGFDPDVATIWAAATLAVPFGVLLAPAGTSAAAERVGELGASAARLPAAVPTAAPEIEEPAVVPPIGSPAQPPDPEAEVVVADPPRSPWPWVAGLAMLGSAGLIRRRARAR